MWTAVRALEEGQLLMTQMAEHFETSHSGHSTDELLQRADEARRQSEIIRKLVMRRERVVPAAKE
jgi:hypothetical protein